MTERQYPAGVPCWVDTAQPDPAAAVRFYGGLFGWEWENIMPGDTAGAYFVGRLRGRDVAAVGSLPAGAPQRSVWNTYVSVDNADTTAATVTEAGGTIIAPPFDTGTAGRMAALADPSGAAFSVWQAGEHHGAQLVNAPNTWNFGTLYTRNLEEAKAFYGAAFGWVAETVDFGFDVAAMWCVRGYGEVQDSIDPGFLRRHREGGSPDGFVDAVGWMQELTDATPTGATPHWSVQFAVDDTDAVAERAAGLGAEVVTPPSDEGPVRLAVLRDPQGAAFTVATYTPPA